MKIVIESDFISIFISFITLVSTIIIGCLQIYQNKIIDERDKKRRKDEANVKAIEFILKYDSEEIMLLPLCVMAYQYNDNFPYRRKIYREFCCLNEEIKRSVLEKQNLNLNLNKENNFYKTLLNSLHGKIDDLYGKNEYDQIFYDGTKYFEYVLKNHNNKKVPKLYVGKNEYSEYIKNILRNNEGKEIMWELMDVQTNQGNSARNNEIIMSYLCCIIATYIPMNYSSFYFFLDNTDFVDDYFSKCNRNELYMENLFLNALYKLYVCLPNTQKEIEQEGI